MGLIKEPREKVTPITPPHSTFLLSLTDAGCVEKLLGGVLPLPSVTLTILPKLPPYSELVYQAWEPVAGGWGYSPDP